MKKYILLLPVFLVVPVYSCFAKPVSQYNIIENDTTELSDSLNKFAFDLYSKVKGQKDNLFFSPFSISSALAMTYAGARSETGTQMSQTLHFYGDEIFHSQFKSLLENIYKKQENEGITIKTANALWAQEDFKFSKKYLSLVENYYNSKIKFVDYIDPSGREKSINNINKWVEDNTEEKIKDLIKPNDINEFTRLILTNAIYFYGGWENQFKEVNSKSGDFFVNENSKVEAMFMRKSMKVTYYENENIQAMELQYVDKAASMVIILPKKHIDIENFEKSFSYNKYQNILKNLLQREIRVEIPKFEYTVELGLGKTLADMGMPLAFSNDADFSGMTGKKLLKIDKVKHKAFIKVNEKGTEAAAATAVVMRTKSAEIKSVIFRADHPFIFIIKDNTTGTILFIGRLNNPGKKKI